MLELDGFSMISSTEILRNKNKKSVSVHQNGLFDGHDDNESLYESQWIGPRGPEMISCGARWMLIPSRD